MLNYQALYQSQAFHLVNNFAAQKNTASTAKSVAQNCEFAISLQLATARIPANTLDKYSKKYP